MKKVSLTEDFFFDDDVSDEDAIAAAIEIHGQNRHFPNDDQVKIEYGVKEPDEKG